VTRLEQKQFTLADIRRTTGLSEGLISQYLLLYKQCDPDNDRLQLLFAEPQPSTDTPAEIKRGELLQ